MRNKLNRLAAMVCLLAFACASMAAAEAEAPREAAVSPSGAEAECLWTLQIDDTVETKLNGYAFTCTLTVLAVKLGGADALGEYTGVVHIQYEMHKAQGNVSGSAAGEGQDLYAVIAVVSYRSETYDAAGGQPELTELVTYDAMALGEFLLVGVGNVSETSGGASWGTQASAGVPAPYRMTVDGGQARIELTTVAPGIAFSGMITGEPIE